MLDEILDRIGLSWQVNEFFLIDPQRGVLSLPLIDLVNGESGVAAKFLQCVQAIILDDKAHFEIAVDGQLVSLFYKIALALIYLAFFDEDMLLDVCLQLSTGHLSVLHLKMIILLICFNFAN